VFIHVFAADVLRALSELCGLTCFFCTAGMAVFLRNVSFHGILLDALFEPGNPDWETVSDLVTAGIQTGVVQPLQTTVYERDDVENAFRFMAHGNHIGKVLIKVTCY
jgi:fatty acid synthase